MCTTEQGPVRLTQAWARAPGGGWENALEKLCTNVHYMEFVLPPGAAPPPGPAPPPMAFVAFSTRDDAGGDLASVYPPGTFFSFVVESSGPDPLVVSGTLGDPRVRADGKKVTIQATTTPVRWGDWTGPRGPVCGWGWSRTLRSALFATVTMDPGDSSPFAAGLRSDRGAYFGTNAQQTWVRRAGDMVELYVAGCGDDDPATREGFYTGLLPAGGTGQLGIGPPLLRSLSDSTIDAVMQLTDNGRLVRTADFQVVSGSEIALKPAPGVDPLTVGGGPAGIFIDYRLSYSPHYIRATANRRQVRIAKRCRARKGRLKVRKRGARKTLVCVARRARRG